MKRIAIRDDRNRSDAACGALAAEADLAAAPRAVMEQLYAGEYQQVFDQSTDEVQQGLGSGDTLGRHVGADRPRRTASTRASPAPPRRSRRG